ncbi:hypothetical protein ABZT34_10450 [Streptomyces sp. NPDC005329]|uniref:hypothetical protein n=1 Tax=Streptomyces sp. NPDC005329 TaxID=3157034 RepID=UPI0033B45377
MTVTTLSRFRCAKYERIEAEFTHEVENLHGTATLNTNDQVARSAATWELGAKRSMARRLDNHLRRCGVCR